ncbi:MAG: translation elongation factor Ts [Candidatus Paceibacterota bacterium]|jgi:elongation factor Ts
MNISAQDVKKLREETGVSMMACKKALTDAKGDFKKAKEILRGQGEKVAEKKLTRETNQGIIHAYIHGNQKIGAIVEVHCETDFVAKNTEFKEFCKELTLQITGYNPIYLSPDYIPEEDLKKQEKLFREEFIGQKLQGERLEKAITSKIDKFKKENSLLSQSYFRDESKTIDQLLKEIIARLGENIQITRFTRYQI